ncbi:TolB family protein [Rhizohabitans arisaemae]|uniref:TolB family protein n=1 Tax=Rhizohabitans arisaemae TaxID=2720610 RepID=UPI0024B071EE|nr:hypothetical protein [Rhizohabitans arisaemae]
MNDDVEDILRRALNQAAGQAPRAPGTLAAHVAGRSRTRRTRARILVAAVAVVVVAGGGTVALNASGVTALPGFGPAGGQQAVPVDPSAGPDPSTSPDTAVFPPVYTDPPTDPVERENTAVGNPVPAVAGRQPIEKVWPQAVRKIGDKLPDGREFFPVGFLDDGTLMVRTEKSYANTNELLAYDLDTDTVRKIADVPAPDGPRGYAVGFSIGGGHVAWWMNPDRGTVDLWVAPLSGGQARKVASYQEQPAEDGLYHRLEHFSIAGDRIVFSVGGDGAFTVPLGGGTVEPVADTKGLHILRWPWVGRSPYLSLQVGRPEHPVFVDIRNVETGETRTAKVGPGEMLSECGLLICQGGKTVGYKPFQRFRDGSQQKTLPLYAPESLYLVHERLYLWPFKKGKTKGLTLHDAETGRFADTGMRSPSNTSLPLHAYNNLLYLKRNQEFLVINLDKIS